MSSTLKEISERLNISVSTVSRALNGKPGIAPETRQRVLELANELRFTPNPNARSLSTSQSQAVGLIVKRSLVRGTNPFYDRIMMGAEQELEQHGYHLVVITIDEKQLDGSWLPPGLDKRRLDGMIVAGCELSNRTMNTLLSLEIPTVLAANRLPQLKVDAVTSANRHGGYTATKHLIDHGHKNIAFMSGPTSWSPVHERQLGYHDAMVEAGLQDCVVYRPDLEIETGYEAALALLSEQPNVTAIFAASDPLAIGALKAAGEMNRKVPGELAIIGFDNIPWAESTVPPLTTLYIHKHRLGRIAARRLLDIIQEGSQPAMETEVENELVIRRSCGCIVDQ